MKQTINIYQFRETFERMSRAENFSHEGLKILFDALEEYEDDTGQEIELDVIALCCDFDEEDWQTIADQYAIDLSDCEDDDERVETVREYLNYHTSLCGEFKDDDGVTRFVFARF